MSDSAALSRIAPVDQPTEEQAELLQKTFERHGRSLRVFHVLAHHPRLLERFDGLGGLFMAGELPQRLREVIILRIAYRSGSEYEFAQHALIGFRAGLSSEQIIAIGDPHSRHWTDEEQLLLAMSDELFDHDRVTDDTYSEMSARYSTAQILELLALPGHYRMLAGLLNSLQVLPEDDLPSSPSLADVHH